MTSFTTFLTMAGFACGPSCFFASSAICRIFGSSISITLGIERRKFNLNRFDKQAFIRATARF